VRERIRSRDVSYPPASQDRPSFGPLHSRSPVIRPYERCPADHSTHDHAASWPQFSITDLSSSELGDGNLKSVLRVPQSKRGGFGASVCELRADDPEVLTPDIGAGAAEVGGVEAPTDHDSRQHGRPEPLA
jgi:hypothetical protein